LRALPRPGAAGADRHGGWRTDRAQQRPQRNNDLYGSTVQLAARLCAHAQPSQILLSNAVAELCIGKALPLTDVGRVSLKGFEQPVHAHAVATDVRQAWARDEGSGI
jgi:class 3 adenylate cyclase